jgi:hypothetical protein
MKKRKPKKESGKKSKSLPTSAAEIPEDTLYFGGLPVRELKKNLGCG